MTEILVTMNTETTPETTPTATQMQAAVQGLSYLPTCATTPKRGAPRKMRREAQTLYAFAVEQGGTITLTDATKQELTARGIPPHRIPCAVYDLRSKCGKTVTSVRQGRQIASYVVTL